MQESTIKPKRLDIYRDAESRVPRIYDGEKWATYEETEDGTLKAILLIYNCPGDDKKRREALLGKKNELPKIFKPGKSLKSKSQNANLKI